MSSYVCFLPFIKCLLMYENYINQLARKLVFGHWMILLNLHSNKIKHKLLSQLIQSNVCMDDYFHAIEEVIKKARLKCACMEYRKKLMKQNIK